jgi:transmembrane secretion effector
MADWVRGRMNAVHRMASQGGMAVGGVIWGAAATSLGLGPTLVGGAFLLTASLALAIPLSIHFAHGLNLDPSPLKTAHEFPLAPRAEDGRYGHMGDDHSSGRPGKVPCPDERASVDLVAQWGFLSCRRIP